MFILGAVYGATIFGSRAGPAGACARKNHFLCPCGATCSPPATSFLCRGFVQFAMPFPIPKFLNGASDVPQCFTATLGASENPPVGRLWQSRAVRSIAPMVSCLTPGDFDVETFKVLHLQHSRGKGEGPAHPPRDTQILTKEHCQIAYTRWRKDEGESNIGLRQNRILLKG